jgi:hypothetical protein
MNKELEIRFKSIVGGSNFMTPIVIDYFERGDYIIELSTGNGKFCGLYGYGVTVANTKTNEHCIDLCESFSDANKDIAREKAMEYINSLF